MVANTRPAGLPNNIDYNADADKFAVDLSGKKGAPPLGVAHPHSVEQIQSLVRWANKARMPLIPVSSSTGPRRRGDTISSKSALIVDLSGMTHVMHVDGRDAVAVIEAGVTFPQLQEALTPHGLTPFHPLLPRHSKSVLATFLEREPITVPGQHWDSADPLAALELVFGNGDFFRTGGASLPGTLEVNIKRGNRQLIAAGPGQTDFARVLQGAQGSLGIVARASILCQRIPTVTVPLFVTADKLESVIAVAYLMLRKRLDGQLLIINAAHLALMLAADAGNFARLRPALPPWLLYVELTAASYFSDEAIAYLRRDLEAMAKVHHAHVSGDLEVVTARELATLLASSTDVPYQDRTGKAHEEVFFVGQLSGAPTYLRALDGVADLSEIPIYLQPMTHGVNAHVEFTFLSATPAAAARQARAAAERLVRAGGFFSRPYHLWADLSFERDQTAALLLKKVKGLLDPQGVLQPESQALGEKTAISAPLRAMGKAR